MIQTTTSAGIAQNPLLPAALLPAALSNEQGNCLIADFMGMERTEKETGEPTYKQEKNAVIWASQLMYKISWDWLMPVIEKIHIDRKVKEISIRPGRTRIWLKEYSYIQSPCLPENNSITECWLAVIKFIIWHNEQGVSKGSR